MSQPPSRIPQEQPVHATSDERRKRASDADENEGAASVLLSAVPCMGIGSAPGLDIRLKLPQESV